MLLVFFPPVSALLNQGVGVGVVGGESGGGGGVDVGGG